MARTNFSFKKRQKEIARQKKQEEKRQARLAKKAGDVDESAEQVSDDVPTPAPSSSPLEK